MCNYVLGWSLDNRSILFGYIQKEQMESKMTGDGFWLEKELLPTILSLLAFGWSWGFSVFLGLFFGSNWTPGRSWNVVEWNPCCLPTCCRWKNCGRCGWEMLGDAGRCWEIGGVGFPNFCPSWSASPSIRYCMTWARDKHLRVYSFKMFV